MSSTLIGHTTSEPATEPRFAFGANWARFLEGLTDAQITAAVDSLRRVFGEEGLKGRSFLDIGSGSGLFSLAAHRLGARVVSFDYDPDSVLCTRELRRREQATDDAWQVSQGSILDSEFVRPLGQFDVVYSWGVLHHTGDMWTAIERAADCVAPGGTLWIALYNDQGLTSRCWLGIKRLYLAIPRFLQPLYVVLVGGMWGSSRLLGKLWRRLIVALFGSLARPPLEGRDNAPPPLMTSQRQRGMKLWYDLVDWIGGYPFEVAKPEAVLQFLQSRGFRLTDLRTCGGDLGCNEYWLKKD
jgi:2-polyprenyl-6-hydroxyphenyl methylase/3-demethylubiquinone-9 3-methyltransferase